MISLQYIAGFFDGEGHIRLRRAFSKASNCQFIRTELGITNTNLHILQKIQSQIGGKIRTRQNKHRPIYFLYWSNLDEVNKVINKLKPYLIIKAKHADLVLEYLRRHSSTKRTQLIPEDWMLVDKMTQFNLELRYHNI